MGRNQGAAGARLDGACGDTVTESDSTTNGLTSVQVTVAEPAPVPTEILPMKRNTNVTLPISLTSARAIFSIATLSRGRAPLAVCLSVLLLGFAAPEIRAQEEPTRLNELVVSDGRVQFFFFSAGQCIRISNTTINGVTYTIHSSKWQNRSVAGSPWGDIPGTEETGALCSLSPDSAGEYRLIADISIDGERGLYSSNILTKAGTDPEPAGLAPADQAAFDSLAVGKQIVNADSGDRLIFLSPGRVREFDQGESYDGDYRYESTGENTGTLTYTYDVTGNNPDAEKSVLEFTFTSTTAGTAVYTYTESGSPPETLRLSFEFVDAPVEPAPVPALPLIGQWLLGLSLLGGGARQLSRRRGRADRLGLRAHP